MRTANGTRAAWLISLGGTVALVAALGPVELRAAQSGESPAEKPTALDVIGELPRDETRLRVQAIVAAVQAAGFGEVSRIEREKGVYEVQVRHPRRGAATVFEVYVDPKTGELLLDPETGKSQSKKIGRRRVPAHPIPHEQIVELVKAEGYVEVYSIQYRHTLYEVKVRDAEGLRVELFVHPSAGKLLRNRGGELTSKNFE
jgi:hypothetical protein